LNTRHNKKFDFEFDHEIYRYVIEAEELNEIQLVLNNGELFNSYQSKRLVVQIKDKGQNKPIEGTDVTEYVQKKRSRKERWINLTSR